MIKDTHDTKPGRDQYSDSVHSRKPHRFRLWSTKALLLKPDNIKNCKQPEKSGSKQQDADCFPVIDCTSHNCEQYGYQKDICKAL